MDTNARNSIKPILTRKNALIYVKIPSTNLRGCQLLMRWAKGIVFSVIFATEIVMNGITGGP